MRIKHIMSTPVVTVEMDDSLATIKDIFDHTQFHHLLVVERKQLRGVISDRDVFRAISPNLGLASENQRDLATLNKKAHQIMSRNPKFLTVNDSVYDAIDLFNTQVISCIPILDEDQHPVGIISWRDIFSVLAEARKKRLET